MEQQATSTKKNWRRVAVTAVVLAGFAVTEAQKEVGRRTK